MHAQEIYYNWEADQTGTGDRSHNFEFYIVDFLISFTVCYKDADLEAMPASTTSLS